MALCRIPPVILDKLGFISAVNAQTGLSVNSL